MKEYTDKQLLQMSKTDLVKVYRELEASITEGNEECMTYDEWQEKYATEGTSLDPIQETSINVELLAEQIAEALSKSNAEATRKVGLF